MVLAARHLPCGQRNIARFAEGDNRRGGRLQEGHGKHGEEYERGLWNGGEKNGKVKVKQANNGKQLTHTKGNCVT